MAIIGLTQDEKGHAIQRLSVSTKIAVGLPPDKEKGRKAPMKLDFFIFLRKTNAGSGLTSTWEIDPDLTKHYGKEPRQIEVILVDDDIEKIFPTKLAWWSATQCLCWGDGVEATRRTKEEPGGVPWQPCGKACPDLEEGRCKPSGDLLCMLADFPKLGSVCRIHTTSFRSIAQVSSSIQQIRLITGGRLAGIKASLTVRPEKTSFKDKDGSRRSTIVPALSLEVSAPGMRSLIGGMVGTANLFQQTQKLLGGSIQIVEDETEQAVEFSREFYDVPDEPAKPKVDRRERERGTLEPGKSENRGHDHTGFDQYVKAEPKDAGKPAESGKQPDAAMCSECRQMLDATKPFCGHHKLCVHAPKDPEPTKAEVKTKAATEGTPDATSAPATTAKAELTRDVLLVPATGKERELLLMTVADLRPKLKKLTPKQLKENVEAKAEQKPEPHEPKPYYEIEGKDNAVASVWDTNLHPAILKSKGRECVFAVTRSKQGYVSIEDVVSIGGVKFARDPATKQSIPADILAMSERSLKNMEEGKTAAGEVISPDAPSNLPTVSGSVDIFKDKNTEGKPLLTSDQKPYVYVDIVDVADGETARYYCIKEHLFKSLRMAEFEKIVVEYSITHQGNGKKALTIEDVKQVAETMFREGKPI